MFHDPILELDMLIEELVAEGGIGWIQKAIKRPGAFRAKAQKHGMETREFADHVIANKDKFDTRTVRQAYLAKKLMSLRH